MSLRGSATFDRSIKADGTTAAVLVRVRRLPPSRTISIADLRPLRSSSVFLFTVPFLRLLAGGFGVPGVKAGAHALAQQRHGVTQTESCAGSTASNIAHIAGW